MNDFLGTADSVSYQMKWKPDTRYQKVAAYSGYYDTLRSVYGCDSVISHLWLQAIYPFDTVVNETICVRQLPATYHIKVNKKEKYNTLAGESSLNNSWELYAPLRSTNRTDTTYEFVFKEEGHDCEAYRFYLNLHVLQFKIINCRDTVVPFGQGSNEPTGFFINTLDAGGLAETLDQALQVYSKRNEWRQIMTNAMLKNFSWENSSQQYLKLFAELIKRGPKW